MKTPRSLKELERIYDALYRKAEKILKDSNPCHHRITIFGNQKCLGRETMTSPRGCCGGCIHLKRGVGCTAEKPLTCKTWVCNVVHSHHPIISRRLMRLAFIVSDYGFYVGRADKQESMRRAAVKWGLTA